MKTAIAITITRKHLNTFKFYARNFGISAEAIMQREIYSQALTITDDVFGSLEYFDSHRTTEDLETISLSFSNEAFALLSRIADLLRRPLAELCQDLLGPAAAVLADYIADALKGNGIHADKHLPEWAENAAYFELAATRGKVPLDQYGFDCWKVFNIQRPKRKSTKRPAIASNPSAFNPAASKSAAA